MQQLAQIYLIAINVITFFLFGIDKMKAKRSKWRIPEAVLLGLAVMGGTIGALFGMRVWNHKTKHKLFKYGPSVGMMRKWPGYRSKIGYFLYESRFLTDISSYLSVVKSFFEIFLWNEVYFFIYLWRKSSNTIKL